MHRLGGAKATSINFFVSQIRRIHYQGQNVTRIVDGACGQRGPCAKNKSVGEGGACGGTQATGTRKMTKLRERILNAEKQVKKSADLQGFNEMAAVARGIGQRLINSF